MSHTPGVENSNATLSSRVAVVALFPAFRQVTRL
jgi:hypothetical protein